MPTRDELKGEAAAALYASIRDAASETSNPQALESLANAYAAVARPGGLVKS